MARKKKTGKERPPKSAGKSAPEPPAAPSPSRGRFARIEIFLGRVFLSLVTTLLLLLVLEFACRHLLPDRRTDFERNFPPSVVRAPRPYVMFGGVPNGPYGRERLNNLGYRGPPPSFNKKPGEFRVIMLGGSTVFRGVEPLPVLLEKKLKAQGLPEARVYNFGVVSSVSTQELVRVALEVTDYRPDLVVMYNGGNDIQSPFAWDPRPGYPFNFMAFEYNPVLQNEIKTYPTATLLAFGSTALRYLFPSFFEERFFRRETIRRGVGWGTDKWKQSIASHYVANMTKCNGICRAYRGKFIVFFQPLLCFKDPLSEEEEKILETFDVKRKAHCLDVRKMIFDLVEKHRIERYFKLVDLSDIFDGVPETVYEDPIHILQKNKSVVVDAMFREIAGLLKGK